MAESTFSLDDLDHRLIALLRTDGRLPVAKLAAELGVSRATVSARMERLVKTGAIAGYTVMLRSSGRADAVRAITMVEIDGKNSEAVIRRLVGFPEIRTLYTTNGRWDVVAEIETATLREFDELLRKIRQIDGIANTETSILLAARKELG
ncbi:Lrp/AsnC family transcriptional regulator [Devosia sp. ZB163]|uniref:Lrp/AsnC family transcriptional regulator n=1 Tax=Devosia sp. ZB163 TaxID=3025938 RepID=UPI002361BCBD|nr:Lrp/AsnC family transcriptional regulator [Devosia sp. ZB163]MDC9825985.1 Lrp/AsnC family transcriptional regulator [Devosia sp. ZB163]